MKRVGSAMECTHCRRWKTRHKCGARPDYKTAWVDYPVEECAACNPLHPRGEFPEGPKEHRERTPKHAKEPEPAKSKSKAMDRRTKKATEVRRKRKRRQLLCIAVACEGAVRFRDMWRIYSEFGVAFSKRSLLVDLEEMVKEGWLMREKIPIERGPKSPKFMPTEVWEYRINTAVLAKLQNARQDDEHQEL